jgi:hypothetical protein
MNLTRKILSIAKNAKNRKVCKEFFAVFALT